MTTSPPPIKWHTIFAALLRELLTPLQIRVLDEFALTGEVDVILIQLLEGSRWTEEQRQYLPDGLRDSVATHLLIEFKYTQSLEEASFRQAIAYDILYRQQQTNKDLPPEAIQTFIVSAKTSQSDTLAQFGYQATTQAGVYRSHDIFLKNIPLLLLNELGHEQYNAFFQLFASRQRVKLKALESLQRWGLSRLRGKLFWLIKGLLNLWFKEQGDEMMEAITAETLIEDGKHIMEWLAPLLTEEEVLQIPAVQAIYRQKQTALEQGLEQGLERGLEQGLERGREEGARQEALALLVRTLGRLFGDISPDFTAQLQKLTLPQLRQAIDLAFEVQALNEFETRLSQI